MSLFDTAADIAIDTVQTVFGEPVTIAQPEQSAREIAACFTEAFQMIEFGDNGEQLASAHPMFEVRVADLAQSPRRGDVLTRENGDAYKAHTVQPEGDGTAKLICHKVEA